LPDPRAAGCGVLKEKSQNLRAVMAALVAAIHVFEIAKPFNVDGRDRRGHEEPTAMPLGIKRF
jgi:hypothetical protein